MLGYLAVVGAPAAADVTRKQDIKYYEVHGTTGAALRASLNDNTPAGDFDAKTRWNIDWRHSWQESGGRCWLDSLDVDLTIEIDFPRLATERGMPPVLLAGWRRYTDALMAHEMNHAKNGENAAAGIHLALDGFSIKGGCDGMEAKANAKADAIIEKASAWDIEYDRRTTNGYAEGAFFP